MATLNTVKAGHRGYGVASTARFNAPSDFMAASRAYDADTADMREAAREAATWATLPAYGSD